MDGMTCNKCANKDAFSVGFPPEDQYLHYNVDTGVYSCFTDCPVGFTKVVRAVDGIRECKKCLVEDCKI